MADLFSNIRLIDYFFIIEVEINSIEGIDIINSKSGFKVNNNTNSNIYNYKRIRSDYSYVIKDKLPDLDYKDDYNINFETIGKMMPIEYFYILPSLSNISNKQNNNFYNNYYNLNNKNKHLFNKNSIAFNSNIPDNIFNTVGNNADINNINTTNNNTNFTLENKDNSNIINNEKDKDIISISANFNNNNSVLNTNINESITINKNVNNIVSTNNKSHIFSKFFSYWFVDSNGSIYYGHFLRIYEEEYNHKAKTLVHCPKYLAFFSRNPFFISFKSLLEEIYINSITNTNFNYKTESLLNILLFKSFIPKYSSTQLSFSLNNKNYNFTNNINHSEISLKLLFTYLTPENIVLLYIAFLMNSMIVILHSQTEIVCPFIHCISCLVYPLNLGYNVINNIRSYFNDYIENPFSNLIIGVNKTEFSDIEMQNITNTLKSNTINLVYCDLDLNIVEVNYHEDMKIPKLLPINLITELVNKLNSILGNNIYNPEIKEYFKEVEEDFMLFGMIYNKHLIFILFN